jgi:hypothetical protein
MQLRLEGKRPVESDRLRQVEIVPDEDIPLILIAQLTDDQRIVYYDETLSSELHTELSKRIQNVTFPAIESLLAFLRSKNISFEVGHYKTYIFPSGFAELLDGNVIRLHKEDLSVQAFGFDGFSEEVYAIECDGRIISACVSARENEFCGEAWVFTDPEFRNQGNAEKVVGVWAKSLISAGKVPFYSHKIENNPSANLAKCLGLQLVFEEIVISYANV